MKTKYLIFILLFACKDKEIKQVNPENYNQFKEFIQKDKRQLKSNLEIKNYLFQLVNDSIYNYWQGTTWDFNGISRQPQSGNIACGYFVTNTLSDLGFKIDRVKLAQAVSSKMIKEMCKDIQYFSSFEKFKSYLKKQEDKTVFIVGLDFHTGYIVKNKNEIYFLHSSYINREGVIKEKIENSKALIHNKTFMIGNLSKNNKLIQNWVEN